MVKYDVVDRGKSSAIDKLIKKSSKSQKIVKKSEKPQRSKKLQKSLVRRNIY